MLNKNFDSTNLPLSNGGDFIAEAFRQYLKHWKWFVAIVLVMLLLALIYIKVKEPVYSVNASVLIKKEDEKASSMMATAMMKNFGVGMSGMMASGSTDDEMQVFSSQNILRKTASALGAYTKYEEVKFPTNRSLYQDSPVLLQVNPSLVDTLTATLRFDVDVQDNGIAIAVQNGKKSLGSYQYKRFPVEIKTSSGDFLLVQNQKTKLKTPYSLKITLEGLDVVAEDLREDVDVGTLTKKTEVIGLTIEDENRQRGKDILNEMIRQYNIDALSDKNKTSLNTTQFLKIRIDSLYGELRTIEGNLEAYKKANKFIDAGAEVSLTLGKISDLQAKNSTLDVQLAMINAIENQIKNKSKALELLPSSIGLPSNVASVVDKYNEVILYRMRILRNSNEENPVVQSIDEQLKTINKNLLASLQNAKNDIAISKADAKQLESQADARVEDMPRLERDYVDLKRQQELKSQIYLFLLQKMEETQLTLSSTEAKAKIVDQAYVLKKPVAPRKLIILCVALIVGFFIAFAVVCIRILRNKKISSFGEIQNLANFGTWGPIPISQDERMSLRSLRTNILGELRADSSKKVITVSSIDPESSKAELVLEVGESLAKAGFRVLVVDLNLADTSLSQKVNMSSSKGISNYLMNEADGFEVIKHPVVHPNLDFLPAGNKSEAIEMYSSRSLDNLFVELREKYDFIIVEAGALEQIPDSLLLSRLSDLNLFVLEIEKSSKSAISRLNNLISGDKIKPVYAIALDRSAKD